MLAITIVVLVQNKITKQNFLSQNKPVTHLAKLYNMTKDESIWNAVYVKPRQEKKVAQLMQKKGLEHYLPLLKVKKKWSDRVKIVEEPLLRSYVFFPKEISQSYNLLTIDGVLNYVYNNGKIASIKQEEIDRLKDFLGELIVSVEEYNKIVLGNKVEIKRGAFVGQKGTVVEVKPKILKIELESLGFLFEVQMDNIHLIN